MNIFKREMRGNLKGLLIWCVSMFALALVGFGEYGILMNSDDPIDFDEMMNMMPRVVQLMMGLGKYIPGTTDMISVNTADGWYVCMFVWCALVAYIHAALLGADILAKEEHDRTSEFLFTKPVTRGAVITPKIFAGMLNALFVTGTCGLAAAAVFGQYMDYGKIAATITGMYITALGFFFFGLLMSAVFTGKGKAAGAAVGFVGLAYGSGVVIEALEAEGTLRFLSPMLWFDSIAVMFDGMSAGLIALAAVLIAACTAGTYALYQKRNLHS